MILCLGVQPCSRWRFRSRISRSRITAIRLLRGRFSSLAHCLASSSNLRETLNEVEVFSGERGFGERADGLVDFMVVGVGLGYVRRNNTGQ